MQARKRKPERAWVFMPFVHHEWSEENTPVNSIPSRKHNWVHLGLISGDEVGYPRDCQVGRRARGGRTTYTWSHEHFAVCGSRARTMRKATFHLCGGPE